MCTEDHARKQLAAHAAGLVAVIEGAWKAHLAEGIARRNPTTRANIVNDYMHELMAVHLPNVEIATSARRDKPFYEVGDLSVRLKMLKGGRPANVATHVQDLVAEQLHFDLNDVVAEPPAQLVLEGMEPPEPAKPPYVNAGYELDGTGAEIARVLAVMWEDGLLCWSIDLRELAASAGGEADLTPITPLAPIAPTPTLPAIVAKTIAEETDADNLPQVATMSEAAADDGSSTALSESS